MKRLKKILISMLSLACLTVTAFAFASCGEEEIPTYTVTFYTDGGNTIAPQTVEKGEKAERPQIPTKEGYTFMGWYCGDEEWSFVGYTVTEDITLTARWREEGYGYKFEEYDDYCAIVGCYLYENELVLPSTHNGKPVKAIDEATFKEHNILFKVVIPEGVEWISDSAFENCVNLTVVQLPSTMQKIYDYAFKNCTSLQTVYLPDGLNVFGYGVFEGCTGLTGIELPVGIEKIPYYTFKDCKSLTSVTVLGEVHSIMSKAFFGCESLREFTVPNAVDCIWDRAFYGCTSLKKIELSSKLTVIKEEAFAGCKMLAEIVLPEGLLSIGDGAFDGCEKIDKIVLPSTLYKIGARAFLRCSFSKIIIPVGVTTIGEYAFQCSEPLKIYAEATAKPNDWHNSWWGGAWASQTVTVYWYSEGEPTQEGNYWRYVDGLPVVWQ